MLRSANEIRSNFKSISPQQGSGETNMTESIANAVINHDSESPIRNSASSWIISHARDSANTAIRNPWSSPRFKNAINSDQNSKSSIVKDVGQVRKPSRYAKSNAWIKSHEPASGPDSISPIQMSWFLGPNSNGNWTGFRAKFNKYRPSELVFRAKLKWKLNRLSGQIQSVSSKWAGFQAKLKWKLNRLSGQIQSVSSKWAGFRAKLKWKLNRLSGQIQSVSSKELAFGHNSKEIRCNWPRFHGVEVSASSWSLRKKILIDRNLGSDFQVKPSKVLIFRPMLMEHSGFQAA